MGSLDPRLKIVIKNGLEILLKITKVTTEELKIKKSSVKMTKQGMGN